MNSVNLVGRLTRDPELRRTGAGKAVCSYSLAVKRPRTSDTTDFIECVTWQQGAEYLCQYGHRGDVVAVSGVLTPRKWTDREGKERTAWEVVTDTVELISGKRDDQSRTPQQTRPAGSAQPQQGYQQQEFYPPIAADDADLPF